MIKLRGLALELRPYAEDAVAWAEQYGLEITVTSVLRSQAEQRRLRNNFEKCRTLGLYPSSVSLGPGLSCKWPAALPGESGHQYGLAWDSTIRDPAGRFKQATLDKWWTRVREYFGWFVPAADAIHAELPNWRELVT